jgi:hypothetical protein
VCRQRGRGRPERAVWTALEGKGSDGLRRASMIIIICLMGEEVRCQWKDSRSWRCWAGAFAVDVVEVRAFAEGADVSVVVRDEIFEQEYSAEEIC